VVGTARQPLLFVPRAGATGTVPPPLSDRTVTAVIPCPQVASLVVGVVFPSGWLYWLYQDSLGLLDPPRTTNQEAEGTVTSGADW